MHDMVTNSTRNRSRNGDQELRAIVEITIAKHLVWIR
jgi:hypothetical protein